MEHRQTMLAVDENGRYHVAVRQGVGRTYTDEEIVRLFLEENEKYGECEVVEVGETVDGEGSSTFAYEERV